MKAQQKVKLDLCSLLLLIVIASTILVSQMPGGNKINFIVTGAFVAVAVATAMLEQRRFSVFPPFVALSVWLFFALISSLMAIDAQVALERTIQMLQILVIVMFVSNAVVWSKRSEVFVLVFLGAALVSYAASLAGFGFGVIDPTDVVQDNSGDRVSGFAGNANRFGILMVQAQAAAIYVSLKMNNRRMRIFALIAFLTLAVAVINSGSRTALGGMIVLIAGCGWIFEVWRKKGVIRILTLLAVVSILSSVTFFVLKDTEFGQRRIESFVSNKDIAGRYENLLTFLGSGGDLDATDRSAEGSLTTRVKYAKFAWQAALSNVPFGIGLNNFSVLHGTYAHSNYMELVATTGFLGLFNYILIYLVTLGSAAGARPDDRLGIALKRTLMVTVASLMMMDFASVTYYSKTNWIFQALVVGSIQMLRSSAIAKGRGVTAIAAPAAR